ncbi:MAG: heavy metal translocating P-type ATPase [Mycoplasmataceae bacterium]|nr:heavy metal translocating P-type ATPase [Mycoplasmataceae bacterium]
MKRTKKQTNTKEHPDHDHENLEAKFWKLVVSLFLFIIVLFFQFSTIWWTNSTYVSSAYIIELIIATFLMIIIGKEYIKASIGGLKRGLIEEDTLVALSSTSAYVASVVLFIVMMTTNNDTIPLFFDASVDVMVLIYIGRYIESKLSSEAKKDIRELEKLFAKEATLLKNGKETKVNINHLKIGDILIIRNNESVPADGIIIEGVTRINEAVFTGEPLAKNKKINDSVFAGTVIEEGMIKIRVTVLKEDSMLGKIIVGVTSAQGARPEFQRTADKIAKYLVPSVLFLSLLVFFLVGGLLGAWFIAFIMMISVMVIACPCSFAMTTPLSILVSSGVGSKKGIIYSSKEIFEKVKKIDAIAFDKTGTITSGELEISKNTIPKKFHQIIKIAENNSSHPIARSIYQNLIIDEDNQQPKIKVKEIIGKGMEIVFNNKKYYLGSVKYIQTIHKDYQIDKVIIEGQKATKQYVMFGDGKNVLGYIELIDQIKDNAKETISRLKAQNIDVYLITGDIESAALAVAAQVGIIKENVYFAVDPTQKHLIVKEIQDQNKTIAFVGDGVNDTIALTQADIGIAMGQGTDAAIEASDIVINDSSLFKVYEAINLSKKTLKVIKRGFTLAIIYNILAISLMTILPMLILMTADSSTMNDLVFLSFLPLIGATAMFFNDTIAIFNALTLKAYRFENEPNE